jgi:crotonobetainyl-CoA:carnitine CoA-transferase CaiB-like acyl-CoA transferase
MRENDQMTGRPLDGMRVLDLTSVIMGPYAAQMLGDLGADVIKVEPPSGDSTRNTGPAVEQGMAALFLGVNRNKRGIVLDLKQAADRDALLSLVDTADVFLHNMRPQAIDRLGLSSSVVRGRNPRLVYAGLHGFGSNGPYSAWPAYDDTIQGLSGMAALCQKQTGEPRYFPTIAADKTSGLFAVVGILAALTARGTTGVGAHVEVPMFEAMVAYNLVEHLYGQHFDPPLAGAGYPRVLAEWRRPYRTLDGHICLMPYTDRHWRTFFTEVGKPELAGDIRFASIAMRTQNIDALYALAGEQIATRSTADWLETCGRLEIPATQVTAIEDLIHDNHLRATGFFAKIDDEEMGNLRFPGVPLTFDGVRPGITLPPRLGEHTHEILAQVGIERMGLAAIDERVGHAAMSPGGPV